MPMPLSWIEILQVWSVGAAEMLPPMENADFIDLFAGADINPSVRERFQARYKDTRVYASAEEMVKDPDVEAGGGPLSNGSCRAPR